MDGLPVRVRAAFARLRKESSGYLEIKRIKGYFFVYRSTSRWDKEKGRPVKVPTYLGRIYNNGTFKEAARKKERKPSKPELGEQDTTRQLTLVTSVQNEKRSRNENVILTALSTNGKIPMSVLGSLIGVKETAALSQVKKLEARYGIRYTAEIDPVKLGYVQYLITVKFVGKFPGIDELRGVLSAEPRVQLALITKGRYDLMIYVLSKNIEEVNLLVLDLRTKLPFDSTWGTAPIIHGYGYVPIRPEFIESLKGTMLTREYAILKELVANGKREFTDIDELYGFDKGRSQYSYHKLNGSGTIKRITICMQNLPIRYIAALIEDTVNWEQYKRNRDKYLRDIISSSAHMLNKYLLIWDTINPDGTILYVPIFDDNDLSRTIESRAKLNLGVNSRSSIVTSIIVGSFGYRLLDNNYSDQQTILVQRYSDAMPELIIYGHKRSDRNRESMRKDVRGAAYTIP